MTHSCMYANDLAIMITNDCIFFANRKLALIDSIVKDWYAANYLCLNKDKIEIKGWHEVSLD